MQHDNQPAYERQPGGEVDKRQWRNARQMGCIERTRGGGSAKQGQHNNQLVNKRQTIGEASAVRRQWSVKRTRDGCGARRGIATTSQQMKDKRGGGTSGQRGGSVLKADGALRQQEVEVAWQEDKRRRW
jgi:hypothetical protein